MSHGYMGKILRVDLAKGKISVDQPDEKFYRTYFGGSAVGLYYLLKYTKPGVDPLGPDNVLTFALSPVTGAPVSGQSRATVVAKSPLTGGVGDSQAGGFWPAELKFAGFDAIVVQGKAAKPVYLWVHEGQAELRDAGHLWGKVTGDAEAEIKRELGDDKIEVAQIGPAGEKLVRFAAIINMSNRAHGRTGLGAVMGSKNLKAIAVRGTQRPPFAHPKLVGELSKRWAQNIPNVPSIDNLGKYGTAGVVSFQQMTGGLPTANYSSGFFAGYEKITGETMYDTILKERDTCYACAVRCKRVVEEEQRKVHPHYGGPEYETVATFGSYCSVDDLSAVAKANELCNMYGVDTISAGATVAFAMDCYQHGIITKKQTGGAELKFGNADAMLQILEMTLKRQGLGDTLAEGSARAAAKLGKGAPDLVVTVKGQELPAHMPQVKRSLGLIYAVNPFGADHESSDHDTGYTEKSDRLGLAKLAELGLTSPRPAHVLDQEKVRFAYRTQLAHSTLDTMDLCSFVYGPSWQLAGPNDMVELARAVTGWDITLDELMQLGERRLNMLRAFNAREGIGREADTLPKKLFKPLKGGKTDGVVLSKEELEQALDSYFTMAGWNPKTGKPTASKLKELGLDWVGAA
ncbi:MAG: aldehyde ferredoxin oxidoreductase family protein [Deinococcus sp.]|nr:aldehyde ferredoxin oxidoreductase family protein [Deinococcus sp.]